MNRVRYSVSEKLPALRRCPINKWKLELWTKTLGLFYVPIGSMWRKVDFVIFLYGQIICTHPGDNQFSLYFSIILFKKVDKNAGCHKIPWFLRWRTGHHPSTHVSCSKVDWIGNWIILQHWWQDGQQSSAGGTKQTVWHAHLCTPTEGNG